MYAVKQIVDSSVIDKIIALPEAFMRGKVEVIVRPVPQEKSIVGLTRQQLEESLEGSLVESLTGMLSDIPDMTTDEIRAERLTKYENTD